VGGGRGKARGTGGDRPVRLRQFRAPHGRHEGQAGGTPSSWAIVDSFEIGGQGPRYSKSRRLARLMDSAEITRLVTEVMGRLAQPEPAAPRRSEGRSPAHRTRRLHRPRRRGVAASQEAGRTFLAHGTRIPPRNTSPRSARPPERTGSCSPRMAVEETGMGRVEDKITKNSIRHGADPGGPRTSSPLAYTGDHGPHADRGAPPFGRDRFGHAVHQFPPRRSSTTASACSPAATRSCSRRTRPPRRVSLKAIEILDTAITARRRAGQRGRGASRSPASRRPKPS